MAFELGEVSWPEIGHQPKILFSHWLVDTEIVMFGSADRYALGGILRERTDPILAMQCGILSLKGSFVFCCESQFVVG